MKILVTGATGFIGRRLIADLLKDSGIEKIYAVSRKIISHPSGKISVVKVDLSKEIELSYLPKDVDVVYHLAGTYDFFSSASDDYLGNILATKNVVEFIHSLPNPGAVKLFYTSTYAVFDPIKTHRIDESQLKDKVATNISYVSTKAFAEKIVLESGLNGGVFRLGVVTGDSSGSSIVKYDGPYYLLKMMSKIKRSESLRRLKYIPLPVLENARLPIVPVDLVSQVLIRSINVADFQTKMMIIGVYGTPTKIGTIANCTKRHFENDVMFLYINNVFEKIGIPFVEHMFSNLFEDVSSFLSEIPKDSFKFLQRKHVFSNPNFLEFFPELVAPKFSEYEDSFFEGFFRFEGKF